MKVLVLEGSPHTKGTTAYLAGKFSEGAEASGNTVERINVSKLDIHPCLGCNNCRNEEGKCVYRDDMVSLQKHLLQADAVVFVSPLYYFGLTAQLKIVIDRFYGFNKELREKNKKAILLSAGADTEAWAMDGVKAHFETMCRYLHWNIEGMVLALGAGMPEDLKGSKYAEQAFELGNR